MDTQEKQNRVPVYNILIKKDAQTITPTSVVRHELPMIALMFGIENIYSAPGVPIRSADTNQVKWPKPVGAVFIADDERSRMVRKYGEESVEKNYGNEMSNALGDVIEKEIAVAKERFPYTPEAKADHAGAVDAEAIRADVEAKYAEQVKAQDERLAAMQAMLEQMQSKLQASTGGDQPSDEKAAKK